MGYTINMLKSQHKLKWIALTFLFALASLFTMLIFTKHKTAKIKIGNTIFEAEISSTAAQKAKGLAGRTSMSENGAMLFLFNEYGNHGFWMAGMKIPIDIVWIRDNQVIGFTKNIAVTDKEIFYAPDLVNKVIEVAAGTVDKKGIGLGDAFTEL